MHTYLTLHRRNAQRALITMFLLALYSTVAISGLLPETKAEGASGSIFKAIGARGIGPAVMGGRVSDIAIDPSDPFTFYVALGTGGVMKTSNNGASFEPVFEKESVAAVGAVAVSPVNHSIVWVGTGEANDRNSSSWGNGVYLSVDGGGSWTQSGLKNSRTIARIALHPADSNIAYVAAMGDLWQPNAERGLYKTTDRGKSWKLILSAPSPYQDDVGCGDVVLDPENPSNVFATLYARRRTPWSFTYGAELTEGNDVGGIFASTDAGGSWKKLGGGLPGKTGRIGLGLFQKDPKILYAVVQSDEGGASSIDEVRSRSGGVFRSEDRGNTWKRMNQLNPRPFYFSQIRVDPVNDRRVYVLGYLLHVSDDAGSTFREDFFEKVHPDCHALAIDPRNPQRLLLGTDGGVYQSYAAGKGWDFLNRMAAGEFYRIAIDMSEPFRIAGGLQDNLNWLGPSATRSKDGIVNTDWINLGGGDGFYCVFDPDDRDILYAESQQGYVHRINLRTGETKGLRPEPAEGQPAFRFHWNSPLLGSRHERGTIYLAGNKIFKLTSRGEHWNVISPDLSGRAFERFMATGSGAENFGVVYTLAESPLNAGMLWAGTDDGKLWLTTDGGSTWTDLTRNLPSSIKGEWLTRLEAGNHDPRVAYLAVDAHRSGTHAPLVFRTGNGGTSWESVAGNLPADGPVKVIREDPVNQDVLYAGTEFHLFLSIDRGKHWEKFGQLPTVAVDDIQLHPRDNDLVIATHGRSLYIIDDISPVRQCVDSVRSKEAFLFPPRPARGNYLLEGSFDWGGTGVFRGANPPEGALLTYYVRQCTGESARLAITDSSGQSIANLSSVPVPGLNRTTWDLRMSKEFLTPYGGEGQKFVRSGMYTVTFTYGKTTMTQQLRVAIDKGIETR